MPVPACGIDFGTSNSLAAVAGPDGAVVCPVDPVNTDPQLLPSLLYFHRHGWHRIGRAATHAYQADPEDGRFIRALKSALPEYAPEDRFQIWRSSYTLPRLMRLFFGQVRQAVESTCGEEVVHATVGRPVRFSRDPAADARAEEMLRAAAEAAGFRSLRFLSEPEAATRYYFAGRGGERDSTVLVFDFGGGTLDLCLARFTRSGYSVLATEGAHIGGTLLDRIVFEKKLLKHLGQGQKWSRGLDLPNYLFDRLVNPDANWRISEREYAADVRRIQNAGGSASPGLRALSAVVTRRLGPDLFSAIEAAKVRLSSDEATEIRFSAGGVEIREPLTRADLRELFRDELGAIRQLIHRTLSAAGATSDAVDHVLLAGGSSALICTQELLGEIFGPDRVPLRQDLFTSIVRGLALDAAEAASH